MNGTAAGHRAPRGALGMAEARAAAEGTRRLRRAAGLTQEDLAGALGWRLWQVKAREQGSMRMTRAEADEIAAVLGTDYAGLLGACGREAAA